MTETPLESIRRRMRESEGRLKEGWPKKESAGNAPVPDPIPWTRDRAPLPDLGDPSGEWAAYGRMTTGFLNEISALLEEGVQNKLKSDPSRAGSESVIQTVGTVRSMLSRWTESAEFLPSAISIDGFPDLLQKALNARRAELLRWGINVELEDATAGMEACSCTIDLFQAILHVLQYCIEQLQGRTGLSNLLVHVQNTGGRIETSFVWSSPNEKADATEAAAPVRTVRLQAAQKLLNRIGGKLVLENIGDQQRAVRMTISAAALQGARNNHKGPKP